MAYTLLTGATGLIGRYLLRDFSKQTPLAVMLRATNTESSQERYDDLVESIKEIPSDDTGDSAYSDAKIICADLLKPDLGLSAEDAQWIEENVSSVVHCAGNVSFQKQGASDGPWNTNVNGTKHLAEFCKSKGIKNFTYVSTSFVSGNRQETIFENDLDCGQSFDSEYEKSKFHAEKLLHEMDFDRLTVMRPCSVTGDTETGYSSTFHGVYWFAQFTSLAQSRAGAKAGEEWHHDVRIFKSGNERHHLVPVDLLSRAIVELHSDADVSGGTFHLTPPKACSLAQLEKALSDHYCYHGVSFAGKDCDSEAPFNDMEQLFYDGLQSIGHRYLDGDPVFDCSNTQRHLPWWTNMQVDNEYLMKIFEYAESQRFGRKKRRKPALAV